MSVDPKVFDGYVGRYELAPNVIVTVTREGKHLFGQATGYPIAELFPESDRDYFMKVVNVQITFDTDSQGRATGLIVHQDGQHLPARRID